MAVGPQSNKSATSLLREWVRDRIANQSEADINLLAQEAVAFLAEDPDVLNQFVSERVYDTTSEVCRAVLLETRRVRKFYEGAARTEAEKAQRIIRWFERMEHQPARGYMRLGLMTRDDLLLAAEEREKRAMTEATTARWYRVLAAGLGEDERVRDRYTPEQVAAAYEGAATSVVAILDGLTQGVDDILRDIMNPPDEQAG